MATKILANKPKKNLHLEIIYEPDSAAKHLEILLHSVTMPNAFGIREHELVPLEVHQTEVPEIWKLKANRADKFTDLHLASNGDESISVVQSIQNPPLSLALWAKRKTLPQELDSANKVILIFVATLIVITIILKSQSLNNLDKNIAVLATAVGAVTTFFGLRLTPEIVWSVFRSTALKIGRIPFSMISSLVAMITVIVLVEPVFCLFHSFQYERQIALSLRAGELDDRQGHAIKALEIFPQRIEAYLVLSKVIGDHRVANRNRQTIVAGDLLKEEAVKDRIIEFINGNFECSCLSFADGEEEYYRNQAISWLFLLEETSRGYRDSVDIRDNTALPEHPSFESGLLDHAQQMHYYQLRKLIWSLDREDYRAILDVHKHQSYRSSIDTEKRPFSIDARLFPKLDKILNELALLLYGNSEDWTEKGSIKNQFPNDFVVQLAMDRIFRHRLHTCDFINARLDMAEIIHMRRGLIDSERPWLFSSDILEVFQFIRSVRARPKTLETHVYLPAFNRAEHYLECDNWYQTNGKKPDKGNTPSELEFVRQQLKDDFPKWYQPDEDMWRRNTVEGLSWLQLRELVEREGRSNWRY